MSIICACMSIMHVRVNDTWGILQAAEMQTRPACVQALIVQFGGTAFGTVPLPASMWGVSLSLGLAGWGLRQALVQVPTRKFDDAVEQDVLGS